jgi:hypothetical protein
MAVLPAIACRRVGALIALTLSTLPTPGFLPGRRYSLLWKKAIL